MARCDKKGLTMNDRTALVTGASRGIGAGIAAALVAEGLTVHALARDEAALAALAAHLGPRLKPLVADVRAIDAIEQSLGDAPIDVIVNNAGGLATVRPLHEQTAAETASG